MRLRILQRLSARVFTFGRRLLRGAGDWIDERPRLAAWFFLEESAETEYRLYNGRMFADLFEQERMLADQPRMDFYHKMITRHIQAGDRVVDLGTGTGILGALAARQGAAHVYAIDHSKILTQARTLAAANRIENIEFIETHSTRFTLDDPVDVILHEQMGDCLFDEGMVANVIDLRDRILKPDGKILPAAFEFFCEPVMLDDARFVPFIWDLNVKGIDYSCIGAERPEDPNYYRLVGSDLQLVDRFLCEPGPALAFDLHTLKTDELSRDISLTRKITRSGRLDGLAIYFRTRVDPDLRLTTHPTDPGRAPHWGYRILRTDREDYQVGDTIRTRLAVDRWADLDSWRWHSEKIVPLRPAVPLSS